MVNMKCKVPTCTFNTVDEIDETSKVGAHLILLGFQVDAVHPKPTLQPLAVQHSGPANPRTEKIAHPKLEMKDGSSLEEQWNFFTFSWQQYKAIAINWRAQEGEVGGLPGGQGAPAEGD